MTEKRPLTFPNKPCVPQEAALFDDRSLIHRPPDCPYSWAATGLMVFGLVAFMLKGIAW